MTRERIKLGGGREVVIDPGCASEEQCQLHDSPMDGLGLTLIEAMRGPNGVLVCDKCVERAQRDVLEKQAAERAREVLAAAKAWAQQGARSKWSTPESQALWDAVSSLEEAEQRFMEVRDEQDDR